MDTKITIEIQAEKINNNYFSFTCPFCVKSKHSKKNIEHRFSSQNNTDNRIENRSGTCLNLNTYYCIYITENTLRI